MRVGLVGAGHWALSMHAPTIAEDPQSEFVGVWGRNPQHVEHLAQVFGVRAFASPHQLFGAVDIVDFAVPPSVQGELAVEAARAGRHLLLEKPLAVDSAQADRVSDAVRESGVAALVFFTARFRPEIEAWVNENRGRDWTSANGEWITAALTASDSPWARSSWRWERGALWDLGPHVFSMLLPLLGPVVSMQSARGRGDLLHLVAQHAEGRTSALSFSLRAPVEAQRETLRLWGDTGFTSMPEPTTDAGVALLTAFEQLRDLIRKGDRTHACDVELGRDIVRILEAAERKSPENVSVWVDR